MSRARNIKPGYFKNDLLAECSPLARILFAGLWCEADREGRLEDRPKRIKVECLPYDDCDVDVLLDELSERGFVRRYRAKEESYIQVLEFKKHQNPHCREPASQIPAPGEHSACTVQAPDEHGTGPADSPSLIPDSPSHAPSARTHARTGEGPTEDDSPEEPAAEPTPAVRAAVELRQLGMLDVHAARPELIQALKQGATTPELVATGRELRQRDGRPPALKFLVNTVLGRRADAARIAGERRGAPARASPRRASPLTADLADATYASTPADELPEELRDCV